MLIHQRSLVLDDCVPAIVSPKRCLLHEGQYESIDPSPDYLGPLSLGDTPTRVLELSKEVYRLTE